MDIMMPEMDGEETLKQLKEIDGFNTPVLAVTADAVDGAKEKYVSEGFIDYIPKPFTKEQIKEKLDIVFKPKYDDSVDRFKDAPTYVYDATIKEDRE